MQEGGANYLRRPSNSFAIGTFDQLAAMDATELAVLPIDVQAHNAPTIVALVRNGFDYVATNFTHAIVAKRFAVAANKVGRIAARPCILDASGTAQVGYGIYVHDTLFPLFGR
jgi:hypothetical protein